jgi:hypothetical protein
MLFSLISQVNSVVVTKYDSSENLAYWTVSTNMPYVIDMIDYKEGLGSIAFQNCTTSSQNKTAETSQIQNLVYDTQEVIGFWFEMKNETIFANFRVMVYRDDGHYFGIRFIYTSGSTFSFKWVSNVASGGYFSGTKGVWYWFELIIDNANVGQLFRDGVGLGSGGGLSLNSAASRFRIESNDGESFGYTNFDYIRIADAREYLPTDVAFPLTINALNVANSSIISVPIKINDIEYYTPISIVLQNGIYIIQPEGLGFNSTYYWKFVNWTDGADMTRTINFTGTASYTAYYRLTKIPDVGGYLNFFIGLFGLCLIGGSWFVLKWQWDEKEYAFAFSAWLSMMMIGFGLCMVMFGA